MSDCMKNNEAQIKWQKNNYVRIPLDVRPAFKAKIKQYAAAHNMTVGAFIKEAIQEKMNKDKGDA